MPFSGVSLFWGKEAVSTPPASPLLSDHLSVQMSPWAGVSPCWRTVRLHLHLVSAGQKWGSQLQKKNFLGGKPLPMTPKRFNAPVDVYWASFAG